MNIWKINKKLCVLTCIACIALTSCGKSKEENTTNSNKEVIGEDISVDTLSFTKTTDNCTSTMLLTYEGDKLSSVGVTNEYANRSLAQEGYKTFVNNTTQYINVSIDSKNVTYDFTEDGMKNYTNMSKEDLQSSLVNDGFVMN